MDVRSDIASAVRRIQDGMAANELEGPELEFKDGRGSLKDVGRDLAEACACFANATGGVIVVGIDDKARGSTALVGCGLNSSELQREIYERTRPSLMVEATTNVVASARLIILTVPQTFEIHSDSRGRATRRVGKACLTLSPTDQSLLREERRGIDWSAASATATPADVQPSALASARIALKRVGDDRRPLGRLPDPELLRARVIYFSSAAASSPPTLEKTYPDLVVDAEPCVGTNGEPCDWALRTDQGYALIVSGNVKVDTVFTGFNVFDGCLGMVGACNSNNGLVDVREFIDMDIQFDNIGWSKVNVVAEVSSVLGVAFNVRSTDPQVTINVSPPDVPNTTRSALGDISPGPLAARVMWAWQPQEGGFLEDTCIPSAYSPGLPFTVRLFSNGVQFDEFTFLMTAGAVSCCVPAVGNWSGTHPEPVPPTLPDMTVTRDNFHAACPGLSDRSLVFSWGVDPFSPADRYNMYRGSIADLHRGNYDHVVATGIGFCNEPGSHFWPVALPDGRLDFCEPDEVGPSFYYLLTGEKDCTGTSPASLRGIEGSTGTNRFYNLLIPEIERPVGTGCQ